MDMLLERVPRETGGDVGMEEWKPTIENSSYMVSTLGRVKRIKGNLSVLRNQLGNNGYYSILLCNKGKSRRVAIHKLVLEAFVSPRPKGCSGHHKDGVKTNNEVGNLEWQNSHSTGPTSGGYNIRKSKKKY